MSELIATKPTAPKQATNGHPPASSRLNLRRKTSLVAGALYLLTFVSIPSLALYDPVRDPNYIVGPGPGRGAFFGGLRELSAALLVAGDIAVLFGLIGQHAPSTALAAIPIALWEFSLGVWLVLKGFKPSPILSGDTQRPA